MNLIHYVGFSLPVLAMTLAAQADTTCSTVVRGARFEASHYDSEVARADALVQCRRARFSAEECHRGMVCRSTNPAPNPYPPAPYPPAPYPPVPAPVPSDPRLFSCDTFSNGLNFNESSYDLHTARSLALRSCESHSRTNNSECRANLSCNDGSYVPPVVSCRTSSNGYDFDHSGRDTELSRSTVINQCRNHSRTSNAECVANAFCDSDHAVAPVIACSTFSGELVFGDEGRDASIARTSAIQQCVNHSRTLNADCHANIACTDGSYTAPVVSCTSYSRGLSFSHESRSQDLSISQAVGACEKNSRTINSECRATVRCQQVRR